MSEQALLWWVFGMCVTGLTTLFVMVWLKFRIYRKVMASQSRIEASQALIEALLQKAEERDSEHRSLLLLMKEWAYSGASRHKDAAAKLEQVAQIEATQPSRADVMQAVENIPDRTAEKVTEKLAGDSGVHR